MMLVLEAFAHEEGYYKPDSRPRRNNNPLDLEYGPETVLFGATKTDGRFAVFPDAQTGWNAGRRWLSVPAKFNHKGELVGGYAGATFQAAIFRFAPPNENNSQAYVDYVCSNTGHKPTDILTTDLLVVEDGLWKSE